MKFNASPKGSAFASTAATVVGALAGGMASRGAVTLLPVSGKTDEATLKKEKNTRLIARAAMIAAGVYACTATEGNDDATMAAKGAAAGAAIVQTLDLVKELANDSPSIKQGAAATTKTQKFLAASLGLACPCTEGLNGNAAYVRLRALNGARNRSRRALRGSMVEAFDQGGNFLQAELVAGQNAGIGV